MGLAASELGPRCTEAVEFGVGLAGSELGPRCTEGVESVDAVERQELCAEAEGARDAPVVAGGEARVARLVQRVFFSQCFTQFQKRQAMKTIASCS